VFSAHGSRRGLLFSAYYVERDRLGRRALLWRLVLAASTGRISSPESALGQLGLESAGWATEGSVLSR
jgi:hypothetical protein